jgi:hypothetical protein
VSYWIVALLAWIAAGARVGRAIVRAPTMVRFAIVAAVASLAVGAFVATPELRVLLGRHVDVDLLSVGLWMVSAASSFVIAAAVWPLDSRRAVGRFAGVVYALAAVAVGAAWVLDAPWIACAVVVAMFGVVSVTGVRHLAPTPLGRGIALFTAGSAVIVVAGVAAIVRNGSTFFDPGWPWALGTALMASGALWFMVEAWVRARIVLARLRKVHRLVTERFPEVVDGDLAHSSSVLRASDQVSQILDALYLQIGLGMGGLDDSPVPSSAAERARVVAQWVDHSPEVPFDPEWISTPDGVSDRRWVLEIARAHSRLARR